MSKARSGKKTKGNQGIDAPCEKLYLDQQLCFALYSASRLMIQSYQPFLEPLGLTYPQYLALLVLWEQDDISVSDLGKRLQLDSGTLSPLLKKLEAKKLLQRSRRHDDERVVTLKLTSAGRLLRQDAAAMFDSIICLWGQEISALARLKTDLQSLAESLRQIKDKQHF